MINPAPPARLNLRRWFALGSVLTVLLGAAAVANAQGLVKGVQDGAAAGNKAAGPVGGVLGGAIGGVVGRSEQYETEQLVHRATLRGRRSSDHSR